MSNMSYCRFQNTAQDLEDCQDHFGDNDLSEDEKEARGFILQMSIDIVHDYGDE